LFQKKKFKDYGIPPQHLSVKEISNEIDLKEYKIFTIVRNPFDRLVSEFCHFKNSKLTEDYHHLNFTDFIDVCLKLEPEKRKWIFDNHLEPQVDFIDINFDIKIFKYENLNECFKWLKDVTGENLEFGHERKSDRKHYREYYETEDVIRKVEDFYRVDLDYFDYIF
jgi:hypothetical protein